MFDMTFFMLFNMHVCYLLISDEPMNPRFITYLLSSKGQIVNEGMLSSSTGAWPTFVMIGCFFQSSKLLLIITAARPIPQNTMNPQRVLVMSDPDAATKYVPWMVDEVQYSSNSTAYGFLFLTESFVMKYEDWVNCWDSKQNDLKFTFWTFSAQTDFKGSRKGGKREIESWNPIGV